MRKRNRKYFITINKGAPCFEQIGSNLEKIKNGNYYLITHKPNEEQEHIHLILEYNEARAYDSIKKQYTGSHIEECKDIATATKYLLHVDHKSIVKGKKQYQLENIKTNNQEKLLEYLNQKQKIKLDEDEFYRYLVEHDFKKEYLNPLNFIAVYGNQYFRYEKLIGEYLKGLSIDEKSVKSLILNLVDNQTKKSYILRHEKTPEENLTQPTEFSDLKKSKK